jgi:hypothetical protein
MVAAPGGEPSETGPWFFTQKTRRGYVRQKRTVIGLIVAIALSVGTVLALSLAASATAPPEHLVTICHATPPDTAAQGYQSITVDVASIGYQQSGHQDQHDADIIPPYSYGEVSFAGKNWTSVGQAIWNNGCVVPDPGSLQVTKAVDPNGGPAPEGENITVHIDCGDGTITADRGLSAAGESTTIDNIPAGMECTVTETDMSTATAVAYDPTGGVQTIVSGDTVTVTVTNTYPTPETPTVVPTEVSPAEVVVDPVPVVSPAVAVVSPATFTG